MPLGAPARPCSASWAAAAPVQALREHFINIPPHTVPLLGQPFRSLAASLQALLTEEDPCKRCNEARIMELLSSR